MFKHNYGAGGDQPHHHHPPGGHQHHHLPGGAHCKTYQEHQLGCGHGIGMLGGGKPHVMGEIKIHKTTRKVKGTPYIPYNYYVAESNGPLNRHQFSLLSGLEIEILSLELTI